ncbi:MAG: hypothetical protein H7061_07985 [Bdellovibrionaceae bacterium]|nr:hypothetical protein [Bdellovibrio sp.]
MKLAYVGYDQNVLRSSAVLADIFAEIEFFLIEPDRAPLQQVFDELPILTHPHCIPAEKEYQTEHHAYALQEIKKQYGHFKWHLLNEMKKLKEMKTKKGELAKPARAVNSASTFKVSAFKEVRDIFFDSRKQKAVFEKVSQGINEYDYVIFENHQLVASVLKQSGIKVFSSAPLHSHLWYSIEFTYQKNTPHIGLLPERSFLLVKDRQYETLVDNWYGCHARQDTFTVQQWVPINQYQNLDYMKFMLERTRDELSRKLDFIELLEFKKSYVQTSAGYRQQLGTLKNNKLSAVLPSFAFWSQAQIDQTITYLMEPKIKKLDKIQLQRGLA